MLAISGATGQLGGLVLARLIETGTPPERIVALARDPARLAAQAAAGVVVREADYDRPETLTPALAGVSRLLLVSGNAVGQRVRQHGAMIDAARAAGVGFVAYTSILHADRSTIGLAEEHRQTEALLRAAGLAHALLRNGWYSENYTGALGASIAHGAIIGASGTGRISAAPRADFAAAAAVALGGGAEHDGQVYELAGDAAFTMAEFAAEVARQAGRPVVYQDLGEAGYAAALESIGLPPPIARMVADSSARAGEDMLYDASGTLGRLIGRPTTPIADTIAAALA